MCAAGWRLGSGSSSSASTQAAQQDRLLEQQFTQRHQAVNLAYATTVGHRSWTGLSSQTAAHLTSNQLPQRSSCPGARGRSWEAQGNCRSGDEFSLAQSLAGHYPQLRRGASIEPAWTNKQQHLPHQLSLTQPGSSTQVSSEELLLGTGVFAEQHSGCPAEADSLTQPVLSIQVSSEELLLGTGVFAEEHLGCPAEADKGCPANGIEAQRGHNSCGYPAAHVQQQHRRQSPESSASCEQPMQRSNEQIYGQFESASAADQHSSLELLHQTASHSAAIRIASRVDSVSAVRSSQHRSQQSAGHGLQVAAAGSVAARLLDLVESSQEPLSLMPCVAADDREPDRASMPQRLHIKGSEQCSTTFRVSTAQSGTQAAGELPADQYQHASAPEKSAPQRQAPLRQRLEDWDLPPAVVKVNLTLDKSAHQTIPLLQHCGRQKRC